MRERRVATERDRERRKERRPSRGIERGMVETSRYADRWIDAERRREKSNGKNRLSEEERSMIRFSIKTIDQSSSSTHFHPPCMLCLSLVSTSSPISLR